MKDHVRTIASCYIISHCQPINLSSAFYTSEPFVYCWHDAAFRNIRKRIFSTQVNVISLIKETGPTLITVIRTQLYTLSPMSRSRFWRHMYPQYYALYVNDRFYAWKAQPSTVTSAQNRYISSIAKLTYLLERFSPCFGDVSVNYDAVLFDCRAKRRRQNVIVNTSNASDAFTRVRQT